MFGIGTGELIVFVVIAVLILGPKETAGIIRKIKTFISEIKEHKRDIEEKINDHLSDDGK